MSFRSEFTALSPVFLEAEDESTSDLREPLVPLVVALSESRLPVDPLFVEPMLLGVEPGLRVPTKPLEGFFELISLTLDEPLVSLMSFRPEPVLVVEAPGDFEIDGEFLTPPGVLRGVLIDFFGSDVVFLGPAPPDFTVPPGANPGAGAGRTVTPGDFLTSPPDPRDVDGTAFGAVDPDFPMLPEVPGERVMEGVLRRTVLPLREFGATLGALGAEGRADGACRLDGARTVDEGRDRDVDGARDPLEGPARPTDGALDEPPPREGEAEGLDPPLLPPRDPPADDPEAFPPPPPPPLPATANCGSTTRTHESSTAPILSHVLRGIGELLEGPGALLARDIP